MTHQGPEYRRAAQAVLRVCDDLFEELELCRDPSQAAHPLARPGFRLVQGGAGTCYGVVRAFASHTPITLVVGRAVRGPVEGHLQPGELGVEVRQVRVEGTRVLDLLARTWQDYEDFLRACPCGQDVLVADDEDDVHEPGADDEGDGDYVCPACQRRPNRPRDWRG